MSVRDFFALLFRAIGALIMALSGACTGFVILTGGPEIFKEFLRGDFVVIYSAAIPLIFGGVPFIIGLRLFKSGRPAGTGNEQWKIDQQNRDSVTFKKKDDRDVE